MVTAPAPRAVARFAKLTTGEVAKEFNSHRRGTLVKQSIQSAAAYLGCAVSPRQRTAVGALRTGDPGRSCAF